LIKKLIRTLNEGESASIHWHATVSFYHFTEESDKVWFCYPVVTGAFAARINDHLPVTPPGIGAGKINALLLPPYKTP
jgi:hypothetical protein